MFQNLFEGYIASTGIMHFQRNTMETDCKVGHKWWKVVLMHVPAPAYFFLLNFQARGAPTTVLYPCAGRCERVCAINLCSSLFASFFDNWSATTFFSKASQPCSCMSARIRGMGWRLCWFMRTGKFLHCPKYTHPLMVFWILYTWCARWSEQQDFPSALHAVLCCLFWRAACSGIASYC